MKGQQLLNSIQVKELEIKEIEIAIQLKLSKLD